MAKLTIHSPGNFFTPTELERAVVATVGGGTGYRFVVLDCGPHYLARARTKGYGYKAGECDSELKFTKRAEFHDWEAKLINHNSAAAH